MIHNTIKIRMIRLRNLKMVHTNDTILTKKSKVYICSQLTLKSLINFINILIER